MYDFMQDGSFRKQLTYLKKKLERIRLTSLSSKLNRFLQSDTLQSQYNCIYMVYLDRKINTTPIYRTFPTFIRRNCNLKRQSFRVHKMEQERLITFYLEALFLSLRPSQVFHLEKCRFDEKFVKWHMHREMNIILLRKVRQFHATHVLFVIFINQ